MPRRAPRSGRLTVRPQKKARDHGSSGEKQQGVRGIHSRNFLLQEEIEGDPYHWSQNHSPQPPACSNQNQRMRPLLADPCAANASRAHSISSAPTISLTPTRNNPLGRNTTAATSATISSAAATTRFFDRFPRFNGSTFARGFSPWPLWNMRPGRSGREFLCADHPKYCPAFRETP